ncbi:MAG TPA: RNA polymerase sigma factor [Firmicutes bacterium]|nr:RNA polymerase sigma factor [Bacillota bacterium]HCM17175.1 RNA polymerase sigma factor [Bacillota bacterium]
MLIFLGIVDGHAPQPRQKKVMIDEHLFAQIGAGDPSAFEELYHLTEKTVYAFLLSILRNHDLAQDIMQETYLKIRSAAHLYQPQGKPLAWIFTIARNLALMELRSNERYVNTEFSLMENDINFSYVSDHDDQIVLQMALNVLNKQEREVILLYAVSGLKHREIASSLSVPLSTVLSQYHRGLKKLKKYLVEGRSYSHESKRDCSSSQ